MKQSNIHLKVTGIRGGSPSYHENKGQVTTFIDSANGYPQFISADAFDEMGDTYKRREETKITIQDKYGRVWQGNFTDLSALIFENISITTTGQPEGN